MLIVLFIMSCVCDIYICYIRLSCCAYSVSSMEFQTFEIKTEADSNDIIECSQDDKPCIGMLGFMIVIVALHLL